MMGIAYNPHFHSSPIHRPVEVRNMPSATGLFPPHSVLGGLGKAQAKDTRAAWPPVPRHSSRASLGFSHGEVTGCFNP